MYTDVVDTQPRQLVEGFMLTNGHRAVVAEIEMVVLDVVLERIVSGDMLEGSTIDLEPCVSVKLVAGRHYAQPKCRMQIAQQMSGDESTPQTWSFGEWPDLSHTPGTPNLTTGPRRQFSQPQPLRSGNRRVQVQTTAKRSTETREWHCANQQLNDDDDGKCVKRREDLSWRKRESASYTADHTSRPENDRRYRHEAVELLDQKVTLSEVGQEGLNIRRSDV